MALTGSPNVPFNVAIKMASALPTNAIHTVVFSGPLSGPHELQINSGGTLVFDDTNWNVNQNVNVTPLREGTLHLNYTISSPYTRDDLIGAIGTNVGSVELVITPIPPTPITLATSGACNRSTRYVGYETTGIAVTAPSVPAPTPFSPDDDGSFLNCTGPAVSLGLSSGVLAPADYSVNQLYGGNAEINITGSDIFKSNRLLYAQMDMDYNDSGDAGQDGEYVRRKMERTFSPASGNSEGPADDNYIRVVSTQPASGTLRLQILDNTQVRFVIGQRFNTGTGVLNRWTLTYKVSLVMLNSANPGDAPTVTVLHTGPSRTVTVIPFTGASGGGTPVWYQTFYAIFGDDNLGITVDIPGNTLPSGTNIFALTLTDWTLTFPPKGNSPVSSPTTDTYQLYMNVPTIGTGAAGSAIRATIIP